MQGVVLEFKTTGFSNWSQLVVITAVLSLNWDFKKAYNNFSNNKENHNNYNDNNDDDNNDEKLYLQTMKTNIRSIVQFLVILSFV